MATAPKTTAKASPAKSVKAETAAPASAKPVAAKSTPAKTVFVAHETPAAVVSTNPFEIISAKTDELKENVRIAAEKTVEQNKAAYGKIKAIAEDATSSLETSYSVAAKGVSEFNAKALEAVRANTNAAFEFATALISVKDISEAFSLHQDLVRKQMETLTVQSKELAAIAQKVAHDSSEPIKATLGKAFNSAA